MEFTDKIAGVGKMQKNIDDRIEDGTTLEDLGHACGYAKCYALRIFKELTGKTPLEGIRALRLTSAARMRCSFICRFKLYKSTNKNVTLVYSENNSHNIYILSCKSKNYPV